MAESPFQHTSKSKAGPAVEPMEVKEEPKDVKTPKTSKKSTAITVEQIQEDKITQV